MVVDRKRHFTDARDESVTLVCKLKVATNTGEYLKGFQDSVVASFMCAEEKEKNRIKIDWIFKNYTIMILSGMVQHLRQGQAESIVE